MYVCSVTQGDGYTEIYLENAAGDERIGQSIFSTIERLPYPSYEPFESVRLDLSKFSTSVDRTLSNAGKDDRGIR